MFILNVLIFVCIDSGVWVSVEKMLVVDVERIKDQDCSICHSTFQIKNIISSVFTCCSSVSISWIIWWIVTDARHWNINQQLTNSYKQYSLCRQTLQWSRGFTIVNQSVSVLSQDDSLVLMKTRIFLFLFLVHNIVWHCLQNTAVASK